MFARINHLAIISDNFTLSARFYEVVFGLKPPSQKGPRGAAVLGDGNIGLNINPRRPGRRPGLDHFGILVEDIEEVFSRLKKNYPTVKWLQRPATRSFAATTTHDPDGNIFDLAQAKSENRKNVYAEASRTQDCMIDHIAIRTLHPKEIADFFVEVFEFSALKKSDNTHNYCVSDGNVTLEFMLWDITDYANTGIGSAGVDHFGFKVKGIAALKRELDDIKENSPHLAPRPVGIGREGGPRLDLFRRTCPHGKFHLSDTDGVLIDVTE